MPEERTAGQPWAGMGGSLLELPLLTAHGAVLLHLLRVQPLEDTVHVETVRALAPYQGAVVARHLACGRGREHQASHTGQPTHRAEMGRRTPGCPAPAQPQQPKGARVQGLSRLMFQERQKSGA